MPSQNNIEANLSVFGSYLSVPFSTKSVFRFLFCYVLLCEDSLYSEFYKMYQSIVHLDSFVEQLKGLFSKIIVCKITQ